METTEQRIASAHLDSGTARYEQFIRVGRHSIVADELRPLGGGDTGPSPYGLLLASLAACTATTLRMYAERKSWELGPVHIDLALIRVENREHIQRTIKLAESVTPEQRSRLAEIAEKTPVTKTIKRGTEIETTFV